MTVRLDWPKKNFGSAFTYDPLGMASWTLGSKSPIHTNFLGLLAREPLHAGFSAPSPTL